MSGKPNSSLLPLLVRELSSSNRNVLVEDRRRTRYEASCLRKIQRYRVPSGKP